MSYLARSWILCAQSNLWISLCIFSVHNFVFLRIYTLQIVLTITKPNRSVNMFTHTAKL